MRVDVYYNLRTNTPSVKALEGADKGRVVERPERAIVEHAQFAVQEGGRQRVLREQKKNVHAFVRGYYSDNIAILSHPLRYQVKYNPYKYDCFVLADDDRYKVIGADWAIVSPDGTFVIRPKTELR